MGGVGGQGLVRLGDESESSGEGRDEQGLTTFLYW